MADLVSWVCRQLQQEIWSALRHRAYTKRYTTHLYLKTCQHNMEAYKSLLLSRTSTEYLVFFKVWVKKFWREYWRNIAKIMESSRKQNKSVSHI